MMDETPVQVLNKENPDELTLKEKRMAVDAFIEKILVSRDGIEIVWKV